jgi:hypothetical protein
VPVNASGADDAWPEDGTVLQLPPLASRARAKVSRDNDTSAAATNSNSIRDGANSRTASGTVGGDSRATSGAVGGDSRSSAAVVIAQGQVGVPVVIANSLAWNRTEIVTVRINSTSPHVMVVDENMRPVPAQLAPPEPWNTSNTGPGGHEERHVAWAAWASAAAAAPTGSRGGSTHMHLSRLAFVARLPALGVARYFVVAASQGQSSAAAISVVTAANYSAACSSSSSNDSSSSGGHDGSNSGGGGNTPIITLGNRDQTLVVDGCTGLIDNVTNRRGGASLELRQDVMLYWGNGGLSGPGSAPDGMSLNARPTLA